MSTTTPLTQRLVALESAALEAGLGAQAAQTERASPAQAQGGSPRAKGGILRKPGASGSADDLRRLPARGAQLPGSPTVSWHRSVTDRDLHRRPPLSNIFPSALSPRSACQAACYSATLLLGTLPPPCQDRVDSQTLHLCILAAMCMTVAKWSLVLPGQH